MRTQTRPGPDQPVSVEQTQYGDDVLVLSLAGEFDHASVEEVRTALQPALAGPCDLVVIDLTELTFLDAGGVGLLFDLAKARADRDTLRLLTSRDAAVNRMLGMTDVGTVVDIVGSGYPGP